MHHDSVIYPLPGTTRPGTSESFYDSPGDEALEAAKIAIHTELAALVEFPSTNAQQSLHHYVNPLEFWVGTDSSWNRT